MDDEPDPPDRNYPLVRPTAKLSKTPSWVMLGFVLGALFVYALMRRDATTVPSTVAVRIVDTPKPAAPRSPPLLTEIEAVFEVWGEYAVWSGDKTEVAYWNRQERKFADYFEVRRIAGAYYFRSIPELTRRIVRHGKKLPDSPLQFTETEEQYREWLEDGRQERPVERELTPLHSSGLAPPRTTPVTGPVTLVVPVDRSMATPPPIPPPRTVSTPEIKK